MDLKNSRTTPPDGPVLIPDPWADLADLTGRRAVVTGGGRGLGLATARALARRGAEVLLGARDVTRAEAARQELIDSEGLRAGQVRVSLLDLLDPASVERFAERASLEPLSILILNAGSSSVPFRLSPLGVESQFATNHLGHFALTGLLLDALHESPDPRVVTVSSDLYKRGTLDLDELSRDESYSPGGAYIRSKLANNVFALELGRRLRDAGSPVLSFAAHPGMARTALHTTYPSRATRILTTVLARAIGREPEAAAVGIVAAGASVSPLLSPDLFWGPTGSRTTPSVSGMPFASVATDAALAEDLWSLSARLTGVDFLRDPHGSDG